MDNHRITLIFSCRGIDRQREGCFDILTSESQSTTKEFHILRWIERIVGDTHGVSSDGIIAEHCRRADVLIVAAGVPGLVKPEWIKPGATVIDVGVNRVGEKISEKTGKKIALLKGDVDFDEASKVAGAITPVPGGVGPMTITMLMRNTVRSMKRRVGEPLD